MTSWFRWVAVRVAATSLVGLLGTAANLRATTITVDNFSFETPAQALNGNENYTTTAPPSWTVSNGGNSVGVDAPNSGMYTTDTSANGYLLPGTADGSQFGYLNLPNNSAPTGSFTYSGTDSLGTFVAGDTYTLKVAIGWRNDNADAPNYGITLLANGAAVGTETTGLATQDTFTDLTYTFTATAAQSGQTVGIELLDTYNSAGGTAFEQAHFDNVRLTYVPEPRALGLFAVAGLGLLARRRRTAGVGAPQ